VDEGEPRRRNQAGERPKASFASGLSQKMRSGIAAGAQHALVSPMQMRTMHASLQRSAEQFSAGHGIDATEALAGLQRR
jgi:hypothetical protein